MHDTITLHWVDWLIILSYIAFSRNNIPIPRTALIPTEQAIENAHERIGGK